VCLGFSHANSEMDTPGQQWHWVKSDEEVYFPARIVEERSDGSLFVVRGEGSEKLLVPKTDLWRPITWPAQLKETVDDLVQLDEVNEASILHHLCARFKKDQIYTAVGDILVCINPFKAIAGAYTGEQVTAYR
jgi:myosin heavy subunit